MTLRDFFETVYLPARPQSDNGELTYLASIARLEEHVGGTVRVSDLSVELMQTFLAAYRAQWSASSTNNKRAHLLCLWRFAHRRGLHPELPDNADVPKYREPKREPKAWTPDEYGRLLRACWRMRTLKRGNEWGPQHWRSMLFVQYDTAHRRGALLSYPNAKPPIETTRRDDVSARGFLVARAEFTKQNGDTVHKLHPDTIAAIDALPPHEFLFPFPMGERKFDEEYSVLLAYAGFDTGRLNKSHKNRRTSATQVAIKRGFAAATMHCRHSSESVTRKSYIDVSQLPVESATDYMDRPA